MPNRVIRDGLIDSEAVAALHDKTFRLYMFMLLSTDDFGLLPIDYGAIKHISPMLEWTREMIAKMLEELVDAGLIMPYEADGKPYAAMSKSKNYIRSMRPKHPIPPFGLVNMLPPLGFKNALVKNSYQKLMNEINETNLNRDTPGIPQGYPREPLGVPNKLGSKEVRNLEVKKDQERLATSSPKSISNSSKSKKRFEKDQAGMPDSWRAYCKEKRPLLDPDEIYEEFSDYWLASASPSAHKLDWDAAFRTWVRKVFKTPQEADADQQREKQKYML